MSTETIPVNFVAYATTNAHPCIIREHLPSGRGAVVEFTRDHQPGRFLHHNRGDLKEVAWFQITREPYSRYYVWFEDQEGTVHKLRAVATLRGVKSQYSRRQHTDEFRAAKTYGWTRQDWIAGEWVDAG